MNDKYILDKDGNAVPEPDLMKWADWFEKEQTQGGRILNQTKVGHYQVSTVFLALDYSFGGPTPILWETMVFDDRKKKGEDEQEDGWFARYATRQESIIGHQKIVDLVKNKLGVQ